MSTNQLPEGLARRRRAGGLALVAFWFAASPGPGAAQSVRLGGTTLTFGGEASGALSEAGQDYFNDTAYERSLLRLFRLRLTADLSFGARVAVLAELRSDNLDVPKVYALYLRLRPWQERSFDVQIGQIPPVFGAFARRDYASHNPLIGYPLGYQYLTTIRDDASPASAWNLDLWRGHGAYLRYPEGSTSYGSGLPMVDSQRWDTGIEARLGAQPLSLAVAVTQGTLSRPRVHNDNGGVQLAARLAWRPAPGLELGASAARGPYAETALLEALPEGARVSELEQTSLGLDVEYSWGYWLLRGEALWSRSDVPRISEPFVDSPLDAAALFVEARYKIRPCLYAAARVDHLGFGRLAAGAGTQTWDADVWRIEAGLGYAPWRRALLKAVYQHNWRDGGPRRTRGLVAGQVVLWF